MSITFVPIGLTLTISIEQDKIGQFYFRQIDIISISIEIQNQRIETF